MPPRRRLSGTTQIPPKVKVTPVERARHRIALSADKEHGEAMLLISVVTEGEGEPDTDDEKKRATGWYGDAAFADPEWGAAGKGQRDWESQERGGVGQRHAGWARLGVLGSERSTGAGGAKIKGGAAADEQKEGEHGRMRGRCLGRLEAAAALGFEALRRRHADDFTALSERVHFSLGPSAADSGSGAEAGADAGGDGREGAGGAGDWSESMGSMPSGSCVAGLPIRTRVSRSGKACTETGGDGAGSDGGDGSDQTVMDDGLIELMYHYGRSVSLGCVVVEMKRVATTHWVPHTLYQRKNAYRRCRRL